MSDGKYELQFAEYKNPSNRGDWALAFAAAQAEMPKIPKGEKADTGTYSYSYASLDSILDLVRPVLNKNGLTVAQSPIFADARIGVETRIYHSSGHVETFGPLFLPAGNNAQGAGSAITYARRYSLCAALGIAPEEDDDGAKAIQPVREEATGEEWLANAVQMFKEWDTDKARSVAKGVIGELGIGKPMSLEEARKVHAGMAKAYYRQFPEDDGAPF